MKLNTPLKRYFAVIWAISEVLIFGGIFFGWGSLVYVLKADGIYTYMCKIKPIDTIISNNDSERNLDNSNRKIKYVSSKNDIPSSFDYQKMEVADTSQNQTFWTGPCVAQDKIFNLGFSIICAMVTYGTLATGQINYKLGTRYTRLISFTGFVAGALMVAFTSREVPWLVFPGMLLIGVAGFTIFFTNVQVAFLFIRSRSIIVAMLTGALATSVATQQFVKVAHDSGISLKSSYIFLACFHCVILISTYGWLPKMFFESKKSYTADVNNDGNKIIVVKDIEEDELSESDKLTENGRKTQIKETKVKTGLRSYTLSTSFALHVLWFCILQLRFQYYIGTLNPYISYVSDDLNEVSRLTNIALYTMMAGLVVSMFAGAFYDLEVHRYNKTSERRQKYGPAIFPLVCSSLLGITLSVVQMIRRIEAVYASFVLLTVFRGFLFSVATAYLGARFPSTHFGILHGIMNGTGGTISMLQYALFTWTDAYDGSLQHVNIFLIGLTSFSLIHPIVQWIKLRKQVKLEN